MNRRRLLLCAAAAVAAVATGGHTPYRQWAVYRKKHLLIGCHRDDPETYDQAKAVVAMLADHLPAAKARVARAPGLSRLASLLTTEQMDLVVLDPADASRLAAGAGRFETYGPVPLGLVVSLGPRALFAHDRFPERHGWLVADALSDATESGWSVPSDAPFRLHAGAAAFQSGKPAPADR